MSAVLYFRGNNYSQGFGILFVRIMCAKYNQKTLLQLESSLTQSQIAHNHNLIEQLLDQCVSVTIIRG
jgi:hypothetical protein